MSIAKHYEIGECLPEDIYQKLLAARTFRAGTISLRQVSVTFISCNEALCTSYLNKIMMFCRSSLQALTWSCIVSMFLVDLNLSMMLTKGLVKKLS